MPRLKTTYDKEIVTKLMSKLSLKNKHDVPKIEKIILNMGLGEDASDGKTKSCLDDLANCRTNQWLLNLKNQYLISKQGRSKRWRKSNFKIE